MKKKRGRHRGERNLRQKGRGTRRSQRKGGGLMRYKQRGLASSKRWQCKQARGIVKLANKVVSLSHLAKLLLIYHKKSPPLKK